MKRFFSRFLGSGSATALLPQFDEVVARRLEAAGKAPDQVQAKPAEPLDIPPKPALTGFAGMIRLEMTLSETGKVVAVAMDHAPFDHVAELEAWARAWTFTPAMLEGKAHPCRMVFEIHWT